MNALAVSGSDCGAESFSPPAFARHRHLQTTLGGLALRRRVVRRRAAALLARSSERIIECGGDVRLQAHVALQRRGSAPTVLAIHGWHGSADSSYMLESCGALFRAGHHVVRLNLRDHGGTSHLNEEMFHSCRLAEVVQAAQTVRSWSGAPLQLLGFSLGANFALRVARTQPDVAERVLAICPVLEPVATMDALDNGWFGYRLYFMRKWRKALAEKQRAFPARYDFADALELSTIGALTELFVERYTQFPTTREYLDGYAITGDYLEDLDVPSTVLLARDDPVIPFESSDRLAASPALSLEITDRGGHCGFIADLALNSWLAQFVRGHFGDSTGARRREPSTK